jgi:hypothetical protein
VSTVNHGIDRVRVTFDEDHLVADAGLVLVATVAARLGLDALVNQAVRLVGRAGGVRPGRKVLTVVHAMAAGADCIDDADRLRAGATGAVLGHRVMAPSTLGTFLRAFTFGHVRQLEAVVGQAVERAWALGAGPTGTLVVDVDSTICEVHGYQKQGAAYGYTKTLGYHPLLATRADTGEVLHARLRKGSANTARGIVRFLDRFSAKGVGFSVTIALRQPVRDAIEAIDERSWQRISYPDGEAHVAETLYRGRRLVVRRVPGHHGPQHQLFTTWRYHAFVTNLAGSPWALDASHRAHAVVELSIRDLKAGPLAHVPSGRFAANGAWLQCAVMGPQPHPLDRPLGRAVPHRPRHPPRPATRARLTGSPRPGAPQTAPSADTQTDTSTTCFSAPRHPGRTRREHHRPDPTPHPALHRASRWIQAQWSGAGNTSTLTSSSGPRPYTASIGTTRSSATSAKVAERSMGWWWLGTVSLGGR